MGEALLYLEVEPLPEDPAAPGLSFFSGVADPLVDPLAEGSAPGFPAAPLLDEELPELEGPEAEPEVEPGGVDGDPPGPAVEPGLSGLPEVLASRGASQPANANAIMAEAIALLFQIFMIVSSIRNSPQERTISLPRPLPQTLCQPVLSARLPYHQVALCHVSGIADTELR